MDESSLSSPLLASSPRREGSPASYNSTENDTSTSLLQSTELDYDAADDTQVSIADEFASKSTAKQTFIHLLKGYVSIYLLCCIVQKMMSIRLKHYVSLSA